MRCKQRPATAVSLLVAIAVQLMVEPLAAQQSPQVPIPSPQELDQLLAPIALYPDPLIAQITAASTNPQEILDIEGWRQQNPGLTGDALVNAAQQQGFDPAFVALLNFPTVLDAMAQNIDEYAAIGAAFSANQASVMDSIQRLRAQAYASGALRSTPQLQVMQEPQGAQQIIVIQPANPNLVYVPIYDPAVVYAGPPAGSVISALITFGAGIAIGAAFGNAHPWGWGSWGWSWGGRNLLWNRNAWVVNNRYRPRRYTYRPRPIPYASRPGYQGNWGRPGNRPVINRPGPTNRPGGTYRPNPNFRPGGNNNNAPGRPSSPSARPTPNTPNNRPTNPRPNAPNTPSTRPRPATRPTNPSAGFRPPGGNSPGERPTGGRPSAFGGAPSGQAERAASARGQRSMGASHNQSPRKR